MLNASNVESVGEVDDQEKKSQQALQQLQLKMGTLMGHSNIMSAVNTKVFQQLKEKASKENEQTQMLITLVEEIMHEQEQDAVNDNASMSSNSIWNKSQFTKALQAANFGSKQALKSMIKEKRYGEALEKCLRALVDISQQSDLATSEMDLSQMMSPQPKSGLSRSFLHSTSKPQHLEASERFKLNISQIVAKQSSPLEEDHDRLQRIPPPFCLDANDKGGEMVPRF